jgi:hypothetical protein
VFTNTIVGKKIKRSEKERSVVEREIGEGGGGGERKK